MCVEEGSTLNAKSKTRFFEIKSTCLTILPFKASCSTGFSGHRVGPPSSQFISGHFHYLKRNPVPLRLSSYHLPAPGPLSPEQSLNLQSVSTDLPMGSYRMCYPCDWLLHERTICADLTPQACTFLSSFGGPLESLPQREVVRTKGDVPS